MYIESGAEVDELLVKRRSARRGERTRASRFAYASGALVLVRKV
jgi:hypothetical protein